MTCYELISIVVGVGVIAVTLSKKDSDESFFERLPELIIGVYLAIKGLATPYLSGVDPSVILIFMPAAIIIAERYNQAAATSLSAKMGLIATVIIGVSYVVLRSIWMLPDSPESVVSLGAVFYFLISAGFFKKYTRLLLVSIALILALERLNLPGRGSYIAPAALGVIVIIVGILNIRRLNAKKGYAFDSKELLASISDPLLLLDPSGKIVYAAGEFLKLCGHDEDSVLKADALELFDIPSDWRFKSTTAEKTRNIKCHLISKSGERAPVQLIINEIHNSKDEICNLICLIHEEKEKEFLKKKLKIESSRFTALYETSLALSSSLEMKDVLKAIASAAESLTKADNCTIMSLDRSRQMLKPIFSSEEKYNAEVMNFEMPVGQGLTGKVVSDGQARILNYDDEDSVAVLVPGTQDEEESLLSVPLMAKDQVIGALTLYKIGKRRFEEEDIKILTVFASQASAIIESSRLYMKLKASEKLYKFSVDLAGDAIFFVDPETGKITNANETAHKLLNYSKSELTAMCIWELHPESQMHVARSLWQEAKKIGWSKLGEIDYQTKNGSKIPATVIVSVIFTGEVSSIQWIVRDISEHKRDLERAAFLQQIFEHLSAPIFISDIKGRTLYANEAFCDMFNIAQGQIIQGNITTLGNDNRGFRKLSEIRARALDRDCVVSEICIDVGSGAPIKDLVTIIPFQSDKGKYHVWFFSPLSGDPAEQETKPVHSGKSSQ